MVQFPHPYCVGSFLHHWVWVAPDAAVLSFYRRFGCISSRDQCRQHSYRHVSKRRSRRRSQRSRVRDRIDPLALAACCEWELIFSFVASTILLLAYCLTTIHFIKGRYRVGNRASSIYVAATPLARVD